MNFLKKLFGPKEDVITEDVITDNMPRLPRREIEDVFVAEVITDKVDGEIVVAKRAERTIEDLAEIPIERIRWTPNDALQKEFDRVSAIVGTVPNRLYKVKEARKKINQKRQDAERILTQETLTAFDRLGALELKQDAMKEEHKIKLDEREIERARELGNDPVFERWSEYLVEAETFINNTPELYGLIGSNDILNSTGIYIKAKEVMDQIKVSPNGYHRDKAMGTLARLDIFFNLQEAHSNSRGIHILDFKRLGTEFSKARAMLYDRLDLEAGGFDALQMVPMLNNIKSADTTVQGSLLADTVQLSSAAKHIEKLRQLPYEMPKDVLYVNGDVHSSDYPEEPKRKRKTRLKEPLLKEEPYELDFALEINDLNDLNDGY